MKLLRTLGLPLVLLLGGAALFFGYRRMAARPPAVDVVTARTEDVLRVLSVTGRLRPQLANTLQPLISGTIVRLTRDEGDAVRRGDVLAVLDAQGTEANIDQAVAQLAARRVDVEQRRREVERLQRLVEAGGLPERDVEQARFALESAEATLRQLQALVSESRTRLRDYTLRSPVTGYVLTRPVDPGQNVTPQSVIYELASGSGSEIEVEIDEQYLAELRTGLDARVSPLTGERQTYPARIVYIGRRVSEASGAVPVRLAFTDAAPRLPVGVSVDVNLEIARHPGAVTVLRESVGGLGGAPFIMKVSGDTVRRVDINVIDWPSPRIVVKDGMQAGDTVVVNPKLVRAGLVVRPRTAADAL